MVRGYFLVYHVIGYRLSFYSKLKISVVFRIISKIFYRFKNDKMENIFSSEFVNIFISETRPAFSYMPLPFV